MKEFFKPEDFERKVPWDLTAGLLRQRFCDVANEKLNKLIESMPTVYGKGNQWDQTDNRPDSYAGCTHKARLAFIEELPKKQCEHKPKITASHKGFLFKNTCEKCGVELQATWSET